MEDKYGYVAVANYSTVLFTPVPIVMLLPVILIESSNCDPSASVTIINPFILEVGNVPVNRLALPPVNVADPTIL